MVASRYVLADGSNLDEQGAVDGIGPLMIARCTFNPSANPAHRAIGSHPIGPELPPNAIVFGGFFDTLILPASATNAAVVGMTLETAGDLLTPNPIATAGLSTGVNSFSEIWDSGSSAKLTAPRTVTYTVGVQALTAGHLVVFVYFVVSD